MATNVMTPVLLTTNWVARHAADAGLRVVEVDVDTTAYVKNYDGSWTEWANLVGAPVERP